MKMIAADKNKIDFWELYIGLSLLIGNKFGDKETFIFKLFDNDWDNQLSVQEVDDMFETSLTSFWNFSKGPGKGADEEWVKRQKAILLDNGKKHHVTFNEFKIWASENLDLLNLMNTNNSNQIF